MEIAQVICQLIITAGIFNVWILRFNKTTPYRGGSAVNMREEFEAYGLPYWAMVLVGALKIAFALCLLVGIWVPVLVRPAALGMAVLMAGAVAMHLRVKDPAAKALPAAAMLLLSLFVAL
jgi:uncharacterized membrane protein YphA (DoxX/SURF4 family)